MSDNNTDNGTRPDGCCGACPPVEVNPDHDDCEACRTGYDCTCRDNPQCPNYKAPEGSATSDGHNSTTTVVEDAFPVLVDLYLDGVITGATSMALNLLRNYVEDDERRERMADALGSDMTNSMKADPDAMKVVKQQVLERLTGAPDDVPFNTQLNPQSEVGDEE